MTSPGPTERVPDQVPPRPPDRTPWHAVDTTAAAARLETDTRTGLTEPEAQQRLTRYGPNELEVADRTPWYIVFGRQFVDVLIFILLVAAVISVALGETTDAITIMAIIVLNGVLGFVQEWRAEQAIEALQSMLAPHCTVVRDGQEQGIEASRLVPGDVVALETGDRVPADLRLISAVNLTADESSLTGESASVAKDPSPVRQETPLAERTPVAWMGTTITNGRARGLVTATGMATEFGRIAELTQAVEREATPLQRQLATLGKWLGIFAVAVSVIVAVAGIVAGRPADEMFFTGVSLAVAVVPEGLPAVVTITLALGIRMMVRRRALLRRLQAAETLGAATVICTDKTGTLTQNEMTVRRIWLATGEVMVTGVGYDPHGEFSADGRAIAAGTRPELLDLLETGLRCNHARIEPTDGGGWRQIGEPTEASLVTVARKAGFAPAEPDDHAVEFSFNSTRKRMTIVAVGPDARVAHVKGAPEVILARCSAIATGDGAGGSRPLTDEDREQVRTAFESYAAAGLRTLAAARRTLPSGTALDEDAVERDLTLLGVFGILDPPRAEVPGAVQMAYAAGIKIIMITGDAPTTARAIAERIGIRSRRSVHGSELEGMDDEELRAAIRQEALFARTTPENKLRIVSLLQDEGEVAAMTGDGVNDAPALKKADIGIAMGVRGTDVARSASDMILTDDNFASIVGAVEQGRRQYDNIQKFVRYLLSSNVGEIVAIFVNILVGGPLILLPVQILWMNLVTDGLTAIALGVEPAEAGIMERPPREATASILDRTGVTLIAVFGGYIGLMTFFLYEFERSGSGPEGAVVAQTMAFTAIVMLEHMNVFNFRTLRAPLRVVGFFSNPWLLGAWAGTIGLQVAAVYVPFMQTALHTVPLDWEHWLVMIAVALPVFLVAETVKEIRWRRSHKRPGSAAA